MLNQPSCMWTQFEDNFTTATRKDHYVKYRELIAVQKRLKAVEKGLEKVQKYRSTRILGAGFFLCWRTELGSEDSFLSEESNWLEGEPDLPKPE